MLFIWKLYSKEGLHRACAQYIADRVWENLAPAIERGRAALAPARYAG